MPIQGRPYRHGVVINGFFTDTLNENQVGGNPEDFKSLLLEVIDTKFNPYQNIKSSLDDKISVAVSRLSTVRFTPQSYKDFPVDTAISARRSAAGQKGRPSKKQNTN